MLHQFRRDMIRRPARIAARPGLAMVQHVDGYGTRTQKLATYHYVARPQQFVMGFKLFYDEDTRIPLIVSEDCAREFPRIAQSEIETLARHRMQ